ncbi:MAG TPA: hypothetical protein VFR43_08585 [Gaiellaceae bacterium]|nr:hypothetical protein [Gaiellaceae bacterium]
MPRPPLPLALALALALVIPAPAAAGVEIVAPFAPARYADEGAVGLLVPGAGPTVTRASARNALLRGELETSFLGGTRPGTPKLELGDAAPPRVLVVLPPPGESENDVRYPIAVVGDGFRGVLTSDSTRIPGLVSITDVASGRLRFEGVDDPVATLETLDRRIERNDRIRLPLTLALVAAAALVALVRPRLGPRVFLLALAGNLWLAGWWAVGLLAAAALLLPLGWACATILAAYLVALGADAETVALSPFGPSQAGRFYGVSNLLETMVLVPALLGASLLGRVGVGVAVVALVAVGGNRFGADGGGLLVLLAGYGVLAMRLHGRRLTAGRALALGAAAVAAGARLVGIDAALGGSSHVTSALGDGPGAVLGDVGDRLQIAWERSTASTGPVVAALAGLVGLVAVGTRRQRGPATDALLAALVVSLLVNDTPTDVLGVGAAAALVLYRYERITGRAEPRPG